MKPFFLLLFLFLNAQALVPSSNIPIHDPFYSFVDEMNAVHGIDLKNLYTRPITRGQAAGFLTAISEKAKSGQLKLSRVQAQELQYYREEYSFELQQSEPNSPYLEKHIYMFRDTGKRDYLAVDLGFKDSSGFHFADKNAFTTGMLYGGIRGVLRGALAFMSACDVSSEVSTRKDAYPPMPYNPADGYPYNTFRDSGATYRKSWDMFTSGIFIENKLFSAELGVDRMQWGPSERNAVTLSGKTPPWGLLKLETDFWKAHYIQSINIIKGMRYRDKYMYAHRLELTLPWTVRFGVNEVLIYGDSTADGDPLNGGTRFDRRSLDFIYTIPFVPYYFAQHYNGDRENTALSFDLACNPVPRLKMYMELYLDDLASPLSMFEQKWYNKWAATIGGRYYFPLEKINLSLQTEYTRVEPWTYTHFFGESHRYRHYGRSLGTDIGPDGDEFYAAVNLKPDRKYSVDLFGRNKRQGTGRPGDRITDIHGENDSKAKSFLSGSVSTTRILGVRTQLEISRLLDFRLTAEQALTGTQSLSLFAAIDAYW